MKVLTEATIRQLWRQHRLKDNYQVEANTILTPSARSFLSDHHIELTGAKSQQAIVEKRSFRLTLIISLLQPRLLRLPSLLFNMN